MLKQMKSNSGASMLFVLAALIVTAFISVALLKNSTGDKMGSVLYKSSASARVAAKSGIIAGISYLQDPTTVKSQVIPMLQTWINNKTNTPEVISSGNISADGSISFTTELLAFDEEKFNVTLRSVGIGKGNSKASIVSVYYLDGLRYAQTNTVDPTAALYLGGGAGELNRGVHVYGGTYINGSGRSYSADSLSSYTFEGGFYPDNSTNKPFKFKNVIFKDNAYFGGYSTFALPTHQYLDDKGVEKTVTATGKHSFFKKDFGMETLIEIGSSCKLKSDGDFFANGIVRKLEDAGSAQEAIEIHSDQKVQYSSVDVSPYIGGTTDIKSVSVMNVPLKLGLVKPPELPIDTTLWGGKIITLPKNYWGPFNGDSLNALYEEHCELADDCIELPNGDKWLVLKYTPPKGSPFKIECDRAFDGKVIWVVEGSTIGASSKMYEHEVNVISSSSTTTKSSGGCSLFYLNSTARINRIGGAANFRGFVYSKSNKTDDGDIFVAKKDCKFYGGIYKLASQGTFRIEGEGGLLEEADVFDIYFDTGVMGELKELGIFSDAGSSQSTILELEASKNRLYAKLLSEAK